MPTVDIPIGPIVTPCGNLSTVIKVPIPGLPDFSLFINLPIPIKIRIPMPDCSCLSYVNQDGTPKPGTAPDPLEDSVP